MIFADCETDSGAMPNITGAAPSLIGAVGFHVECGRWWILTATGFQVHTPTPGEIAAVRAWSERN